LPEPPQPIDIPPPAGPEIPTMAPSGGSEIN
jgi:hypothetical protein